MGKAIYVDTEGSFRPERIIAISERFGLDPELALENISFARAHNVDHQNQFLVHAAALLANDCYSLLSTLG